MSKAIIDRMGQAMEKCMQSLQKELMKVRTGRASTSLVDGIQVEYYGSPTPLTQVANITTPDARTIQITPWEATVLGAIEKAILASNIGITPQNDGKVIRVPLPALTEDRRKEMVKLVKKLGEDAKVGIRNCRRDANDEIKKEEKAKTISEDESKKVMDQVQKKTDERTGEIDKIIAGKEKEIMTV